MKKFLCLGLFLVLGLLVNIPSFGADDPNLENLKKAVQDNPKDFKAHLELAEAFADQELWKDATDELKIALEIQPKSFEGIARYTICLFKSGEKDQAQKQLESLKTLVQENSKDFSARFNLGLAYSGMEQSKEAVVELEAAREIDPKNVEVLGVLTMIFAETGEKEKAKKYVEEIKKLDKKEGDDLEKQIEFMLNEKKEK